MDGCMHLIHIENLYQVHPQEMRWEYLQYCECRLFCITDVIIRKLDVVKKQLRI